jgi:hypothetical protein
MEGLIAQAPPGCDRIFMWFQKNGYINHYKCIRRHPDTSMWFELDSLDAGITRQAEPMLDEDWAGLVGDFYFAGAIDGNAYAGDLGWCPPSQKIIVDDVTTIPLVDWDGIRISHVPLKPFRRPPPNAGDRRRAGRVPGVNYDLPHAANLASDSDDDENDVAHSSASHVLRWFAYNEHTVQDGMHYCC